MTSVYFAPAARYDLVQIWSYTADRWSIEQADAYVGAIHASLYAAATNAPSAYAISDVRPGYWRTKSGHHICFFKRRSQGGIDVVRILHERMDAGSHL